MNWLISLNYHKWSTTLWRLSLKDFLATARAAERTEIEMKELEIDASDKSVNAVSNKSKQKSGGKRRKHINSKTCFRCGDHLCFKSKKEVSVHQVHCQENCGRTSWWWKRKVCKKCSSSHWGLWHTGPARFWSRGEYQSPERGHSNNFRRKRRSLQKRSSVATDQGRNLRYLEYLKIKSRHHKTKFATVIELYVIKKEMS